MSYLWQRFLKGLHSQHKWSRSAPIIVPEGENNIYFYQFHNRCKKQLCQPDVFAKTSTNNPAYTAVFAVAAKSMLHAVD